jgi:hypothetical protein
MTVEWQNLDCPLGRGMDGNTAETALEPGVPKLLTNGHYQRPRAYPKRTGFDVQLGATLGAGGDLLSYAGRLMARVSPGLFDFVLPNSTTAAAGAWVNRGNFRAVPTRSKVVKSLATDLQYFDSYSVNGYTMLAWFDGVNFQAQIIDESTGAVADSHTISWASFGYPAANLMPGKGFQVTGIIDPGGAGTRFVFVHLGYAFSIVGQADGTWSWSAPVHPVAGTWTASRIVWDAGTLAFYLGVINATTVGYAKLNNGLGTTTTTTQAQATTAGSPLAVAYNNNVVYLACVIAGSLKYVSWATGVWVGATNIATLVVPQHIAFVVANPGAGATGTVIYDDSSTYGTFASTVSSCVVFSGGGGGAPAVLFRGCSLASDGLYASDGSCYFEVIYYSKITATMSPAVLTAAQKANNGFDPRVPTLNSATFVVTLDGQVCARVLRANTLPMGQIHSVSATATGLLFGTRAISSAETAMIQTAISLGAAAHVRFNLSQEKARGITAFRDFLSPGGSPQMFDGRTPSELNFHLYPEIFDVQKPTLPGSLTAINKLWSHRSTAYGLGTIADQEGLDNGNLAACNLWVCVVAGTTAGSIPAGYYAPDRTVITSNVPVGAFVQDGTSVWQNLGPQLPEVFFVGASVVCGHVFINASAGVGNNGFIYVTTNTGATANTAQVTSGAPVWPTVIGNSVSVGGITYTCAGQVYSQLTASKAYTYGVIYSHVDDQGQLERSALCPLFAVTLNGSTNGLTNNPCVKIVSLRLTGKTLVRSEVYRTAGDGSTMQQIATIQNLPACDLTCFIDTCTDANQAQGVVVPQGSLGDGQFANRPPPSCTSMAPFGNRVVCNSLENPYAVYPSKLINDGYAAAWADELPLQLNGAYGEFVGVMEMDGTAVIFQEGGISRLDGEGPDNTGGGTPFYSVRTIATDVGCNNVDSLALTDKGIVFQSGKGIYLLTRNFQTEFIGEPVMQTLVSNVTAVVVDPLTHQVVFIAGATSSNFFIWDYDSNAWAMWTVGTGPRYPVSVAAFQGVLVLLNSGGYVTKQSGATYVDAASGAGNGKYAWAADFAAVRFNAVSGYGRARQVSLKFQADATPPTITVGVKEDYAAAPAYTLPGVTLQNGQDTVQARFRKQKLEAVGLVITESVPGGALMLEGMTFQLGIKRGLKPIPPGKRGG